MKLHGLPWIVRGSQRSHATCALNGKPCSSAAARHISNKFIKKKKEEEEEEEEEKARGVMLNKYSIYSYTFV